ncbi:unnamed protein product [Callosobruchus maculatus]|uniref:Uncharacterized protein n=1 Tax=Callosobruchus maculatus TaxID=64391 RepID=A0A653BZT3_CALMS|nr:unnamed protein product [Callosobruchus maculatus]
MIKIWLLSLGNLTKPLLIGSSVKMASNRPGSIEQEQDRLEDFGLSLLSMENLDRSSPELWPEKIPGMTEFISSFQTTPQSTTKPPYSKELSQEDQNYMHRSLPDGLEGIYWQYREGIHLILMPRTFALSGK